MQSNRVDKQKIKGGIIASLLHDSLAKNLGLKVGDIITHINGVELLDILDYRFQIAEESIVLEVRREEETFSLECEKEYDEDLGVEFDDVLFDQIRRCQNNCDFCFIYQLPKKMRRSLYVKDDDYRLSFLYGNYVTLAGLKEFDYQKIIEYNLSPLYVSVHATDLEARRELLRNPKAEDIIDRISYLIQNGIEVYTQAVICPGLNEGPILEQTMNDLVKLYPGVKALGIVPVGLTQYQSRLKNMQVHTVAQARETIAMIEKYQKAFILDYGHPFMQIADEFYLKAEMPVPSKEHYADFQLLENGIGGIRQFVDSFSENYDPQDTAPGKSVGVITGKDGAYMFKEYILPVMNPSHRQKIQILEIENQHFGNSVTVSGLMVGSDILKQVKPGTADRYLLPSNCLKFDTPVFLDDLGVTDLEKHLGAEIMILNPGAVDFLEGIFEA
ncbi:MAG: DUF512 domain-containing protein [Candidatus Cloacimonetes bacterium]|nr:DUF512 domain-containing protein [Candidatus Cloacimonadota bacterium]